MLQCPGRILTLVVFVCALLMNAVAQPTENPTAVSIVPRPVTLSEEKGFFQIDGQTTVVYDTKDAELDSLATQLASQLRTVTGFDISCSTVSKGAHSIVLIVDPTNKGLRKEGYELRVTQKEITITGFDEAGTFYGTQTLFQLLPPAIECRTVVYGMTWKVPCVNVVDYPRFSWRGMHLDVGRHFFPVRFIKKYLDLMAMYKLNVFHWHLTEDQGWRIEIKRYPKLTQVGAWRKQTMGDGVPYGGFYTQDEIRDVVAYAQQRHIEIVPEIEMPGHAKAALAAYPEFSCRQVPLEVGTKWGVEKDVFCAGNDSTFTFLENILTEVFELFPGKYIHIGGDECPKDRWKECPKCQARMKAEGLKDEQELQSYFIKRIEQFVNSKGKRVIGWDEILEGGLAPNATVMSWRGTQGGIDAARSGHDVVMSPTSNCYFDYAQSLTGEQDMTDAFLPMDSVYNYEPVPKELSPNEARHVLGSQGNMWTEYMADSKRAEYMLLPRMCALSEMVWTQKDLRNYDDFIRRMNSQYVRLQYLGVDFRVPSPFTLGGDVMSFGDTSITFDRLPPDARAYYTLDGSEPTQDATLYSGPVLLNKSETLKTKLFLFNGMRSNTVWINFSKLDSVTNGLRYVYRQPGADNSAMPAHWVEGKSGVTYEASLPENPATPGPFAVRFAGFLTIEKEGLYTFYLRADSGSILSVNSVQLVNGGPPDPQWWRNGKIYLREGKYPISIFDLELDEWRGVTLEYEGPGIERQSIPPRFFSRR
jgi:hexosaminidase